MKAYSVPMTETTELLRTRLVVLKSPETENPTQVVEVKNGQLVIPEQLLAEMGVLDGEAMEMSVVGSTLVIKPSKFSTPMDDTVLEQLIHEGIIIGA